MTLTALPITSAGRFSPRGPLGIAVGPSDELFILAQGTVPCAFPKSLVNPRIAVSGFAFSREILTASATQSSQIRCYYNNIALREHRPPCYEDVADW